MLDFEKVLDILDGLILLKFYPGEPAGRLAVAKLVAQMATTHEQVEWLVTRTVQLCNDWPGPLALRQIFCRRYKPADGIEVYSTDVFPDGVPYERPIEAPARPALPPGHVATVDAGLDKQIQAVAAAKSMDVAPYEPPPDDAHLEELRRARLRRQHREIFEAMGLKPITQEDIDRAVEEARAKKRSESS